MAARAKAVRPLKISARAGETDRDEIFSKNGAAFSVQARAGVTEITLYDEIGRWGVSAKMFRAALESIETDEIVLNINSPGGDVFDGVAIYNDLLAHKASVVVRVTGLAASAASLIAMAGDEIEIAENAFFMIHNAWSIAVGDAREMTARAKLLKTIDGKLADTYASRTGQEIPTIKQQMDDETWLTAEDAVELGFADRLIDNDTEAEAKASFDLAPFKNVPRALKATRRKTRSPKPDAPLVPAAQTDFSSLVAALNALHGTIAA
ncbi:Prophage Clp protease-like protein [Hyphomicrobium sulfonivorans]|uniref:ATP-dependent Clp protease proteolytic subunit n=1 Tax=Hyphomicrobium sulfonivorans TaxID=121290 RepID=A0A109BP55_HYPSL|nr:head maturation protease, ClpP-related [Hyphomicrobium sulfonivorans]KWT72378.1 Prophage Clp protease-like protein [Hyphomicrobium sulfonivorans]